MASSLEQFLSVKNVILKEKTIPVVCKDGTELEVDIKQLPMDKYQKAKASATYSYPTPTGGVGIAQSEEIALAYKLAVAGITAPNLNNVQLRKHCDTHSSEGVLEALFEFDQVAKIALEVSNLTLGEAPKNDKGEVVVDSGTNPKKIEEAKN